MTDPILYGLLLAILTCTVLAVFSTRRTIRVALPALEILLLVISGRYRLFWQGGTWAFIGLGFLGGQILSLVSIALVNRSLRKAWQAVHPLSAMARHYLLLPLVFHYLVLACYEELLWRGTIQVLLGSSAWAVLVTAVFFVLRHLVARETVYLWELLDLFLFACILGFLFLNTQSIYLVILIHVVRNINLHRLRWATNRRNRLDREATSPAGRDPGSDAPSPRATHIGESP